MTMTQQDLTQIMSRIISLESEITSSIINGHKPSENDIFKEKRNEIILLRCMYFGYKSKYCKYKLGFHGTPVY